jgi:hypothetical protein
MGKFKDALAVHMKKKAPGGEGEDEVAESPDKRNAAERDAGSPGSAVASPTTAPGSAEGGAAAVSVITTSASSSSTVAVQAERSPMISPVGPAGGKITFTSYTFDIFLGTRSALGIKVAPAGYKGLRCVEVADDSEFKLQSEGTIVGEDDKDTASEDYTL